MASGKLYKLISYEMKVLEFRINADAFDRLEKDESSVLLFNLLRRLAIVFGGRAVHDAVCHYLAMNGYDVHKF